jgi:hypothetical protein
VVSFTRQQYFAEACVRYPDIYRWVYRHLLLVYPVPNAGTLPCSEILFSNVLIGGDEKNTNQGVRQQSQKKVYNVQHEQRCPTPLST